MRHFVYSVFAVALLACAVLPAQRGRKAWARWQTEFGSDTPVERPVKLPQDVLEQLLEFKEKGEKDEVPPLKGWLKDNNETEADATKYFTAAVVNINDDIAPDMIVQAESGPFIGAHLTSWWLFSGVDRNFGARFVPGYYQVFFGRGDSLTILKTSTYGYRDIETMNFAALASQFYYTVWKFDGREYQPRLCTVESGGKRVHVVCDW